ncbi:MAG: hypothetical protein JWP23_819 [Phenylobacterium sp.]|nr:hypothetical protein [Phenylobacterium sp.]
MPAVSAARLQRRFSVHGAEENPSRARLVEGVSFEDAALHFLEDRHIGAAADEVSLLVEDCESGERQCFRVDLSTGETAPCD